MNKTFSIALILGFFMFFSSFMKNISAHNKSKDFTVSFCIGNIIVSRKGIANTAKSGDSVRRNDVFRLGKNTMLQITSSSSATYSIKGPSIFRFTDKAIKRDLNRAGYLYSLYKKITRNTRHYYPRTIVTAVRGEDSEENRAANIRLSGELKKGIRLYQQSRYKESLALFKKISSYSGLRRHSRYLITFYRGEILFSNMDYAGALEQYRKVYRTKNRKFRHRENAHGKAILSAMYSGNESEALKLVEEYRETYGKNGLYSGMIKNMNIE